jgi:hypothetical protein
MRGGQENGRREGRENVPYIVGIGLAAELLPSVRSINIIISAIHPFNAAIQSHCGVIGSVELCVIGSDWSGLHLICRKDILLLENALC